MPDLNAKERLNMTLKQGFLRPTALAVAISMGVAGCATIDHQLGQSSGATACAVGGAVGAVAGALIAVASNGKPEVGAVAGAGLGCGLTMLYQSRVKRLQAIAQAEHMDMDVKEIVTNSVVSGASEGATVGIEAQARDSAMFAPASAELTPEGVRQLRKIAETMAAAQKAQSEKPAQLNQQPPAGGMKILVVGHTDSTGEAQFNQSLSEKRARAVGNILAEAGIKTTDIYYQGAGSSRPVADNSTVVGRSKNRRVEMSQIDNQKLLVERVRSERNNTKYLEYGTRTQSATAPAVAVKTSKVATSPAVAQVPMAAAKSKTNTPVSPSISQASAASQESSPAPSPLAIIGKGGIDFGGHAVTNGDSTLAQSIAPKKSMFSLISSAYASAPVGSCIADMPRTEGEVMNLGTGKSIDDVDTSDFLPGMNGRPWAQLVNGHLASIGPVSILKADSTLAAQPFMSFKSNYKTSKEKQISRVLASANTYDGETQVLYRVFSVDAKSSPVSCMDIVFDKRTGQASGGEIYYPRGGTAFVAAFDPSRQ
jgi:outer membrane protein OmpA-like peptidoglycan-associated protein